MRNVVASFRWILCMGYGFVTLTSVNGFAELTLVSELG